MTADSKKLEAATEVVISAPTVAPLAQAFAAVRHGASALERGLKAAAMGAAQLADALNAAFERRAEIRAAGIVKVTVDKKSVTLDPAKFKLDTAGGFADYVIQRCGLSMDKRQVRRGLTAGAVRAFALARNPDLDAESPKLPRAWDACEALVAEIESDQEWDAKAQRWRRGKTRNAQAFRGLTLGDGDTNVATALGERLDATADAFAAPGADQLAVARSANGGAERRKAEREQAARDYGKTGARDEVRKVLAKLAKLATDAKDPAAALGGWANILRAELTPEKVTAALAKAQEGGAA